MERSTAAKRTELLADRRRRDDSFANDEVAEPFALCSLKRIRLEHRAEDTNDVLLPDSLAVDFVESTGDKCDEFRV
jgi:hypothetical protein